MAKTNNNYARLREEADIATVIDHLQIPITKRGNAYFILCPLPEHEDNHPTNCYFKDGWNHVHCCVCGKTVNAINLIMLTTNCSYGEAADLLWELEGRPEWYYEDQKKKRAHKSISISKEEAELIGLKGLCLSRVMIPESCSPFKENLSPKEQYDPKEIDGYLKCRVIRINRENFMSEKEYKALILTKCKEKTYQLMHNIFYLQNLMKSMDPSKDEFILYKCKLNEWIEEEKTCKLLYSRVSEALK